MNTPPRCPCCGDPVIRRSQPKVYCSLHCQRLEIHRRYYARKRPAPCVSCGRTRVLITKRDRMCWSCCKHLAESHR
jgi:hypothetical protein